MEGLSDKKTALWMTAMELGAKTGCHQRADRSFFVGGHQLPVCARCTGIAAGQLVGAVVATAVKPPFLLSALLIIPCAIDGGLQLITGRNSNNLRRLATGFFAGLGVALLYACAIRKILQIIRK